MHFGMAALVLCTDISSFKLDRVRIILCMLGSKIKLEEKYFENIMA
jgi:hypothetical protein